MKKFSLLISLFAVIITSSHAQFIPIDEVGVDGTGTDYHTEPPSVPSVEANKVLIEYTPLVKITDSSAVHYEGASDSMQRIIFVKDWNNNTIQKITKDYSNGKSLIQFKDRIVRQGESFVYLPYSTEHNTKRYTPYTEQTEYYLENYSEDTDETSAYSYQYTKNISNEYQRGMIVYPAGKGGVGLDHGTQYIQITNTDTTFRIWEYNSSSGTLESTRKYEYGKLHGTKSIDPYGIQTIIYKDYAGKLIAKIQQYENWPTNKFYYTQYVYDDMDRLIAVLPPKAFEAIGNSSTISLDIFNRLCFQYYYDEKGRKYRELKPGEEAFTEYVFDKFDRVVMSQTPIQKSQNLWSVVFYDGLGRVKGNGILESSESRSYWQNLINTTNYHDGSLSSSNLVKYLATNIGEKLYSFSSVSDLRVDVLSYYDSYVHAGVDTIGFGFHEDLFSSSSTYHTVDEQPKLSIPYGKPTITLVRVLKESGDEHLGEWTKSVIYYDVKDRVILTRSTNEYINSSGTPGNTYTSVKYDFLNTPLIEKNYRSYRHDSEIQEISSEQRYLYDDVTHRMVRIEHRIGGTGDWNSLVQYSYDDFGRVKDENLGTYVEQRRYEYNIRGALNGINADYALTGNKDGKNITFGQRLYYDYGFSNVRYDGKIAGMIWRGAGGTEANMMSYGYNYDGAGRLIHAEFREFMPTLDEWVKTKKDFTVSGISYDANGNILSMHQRGIGVVDDEIVPIDMDDMTYSYETNSNRLMAVQDEVDDDYNIGDFQDRNTDGDDYAYDIAGNLSKDKNKDIDSVFYNHLNFPERIYFNNGSNIRYIYNAGGKKIEEITDDGTTIKHRKYISDLVYIDDEFQYMNHATGRIIYYTPTEKYKYEYFVKDHLGNVRSIVTQENMFTMDYLATYEIASAFVEGLIFETVNEIRDDNPEYQPTNQYSGRLSAENLPVGTSLVLQVMSGDRFSVEVENYYMDYNASTDSIVDMSELFTKALGLLLQGPGGTPTEQGYTQLVSGFFNSQNLSTFTSLTAGDMDSLRPQGTLNYILYDEQMNIVPSASGSIQVNGEGEWSIIGTDGEITIPVNGYLVIYLGNRSFHEVYFDNLLIKMRKGKLLEETHYYPHGLPMGMMGTSSVTTVENRHKHQGNEYKKELGLNWMDFGFRQYDPQIGRFLGVDPLADYYGQDRYSPYAAMGNQPESMIDPNGLSYKHTFTSITGLEAPGLTSEQMESLERIGRLSFLKFEDHVSYALFQSFGVASGGDGNNTGYSYNSENQGSFIRSYFYSLIIFHAGNPGVGNANVETTKTFGDYTYDSETGFFYKDDKIYNFGFFNGYIGFHEVEELKPIDYVYDKSKINNPKNKDRWYEGITNCLLRCDAWINRIGHKVGRKIESVFGNESSWMGEEGWRNKGYPTMKYTWGTLATVATAGAFALESSALAHSSIMGTAKVGQVANWMYSGTSLGIGAYNTYVPDNYFGNKAGRYFDAIDIVRFRNPFGVMNYGFRGIDYYQSQNKK